jgi:hypothetical protein
MAIWNTTIEANGSSLWMNSNGVLTSMADNVLCVRLARALHIAAQDHHADSIDQGLVLLAELKRQGFGVIYQGEPEAAEKG